MESDFVGVLGRARVPRPLAIVGAVALAAVLAVAAYYAYKAYADDKKKKKPHRNGKNGGGGGASPKLMETPPTQGGASGMAPSQVSSCTGNCVVDPQTGFQTFAKGSMAPQPKSCYEGSKDADYQHLGSYVKPRYMVQGCISESCGNSLSSASRCRKVAKPSYAEANGLSSGDLMFPGPDEACGKYCDMDYSRYDPCSIGAVACDPCKVDQTCSPFSDTVIDEPRDLAYLEGLRGDATFLTTNFLQSRDLRGDIPVGIPQCALHCNPGECGPSCCVAPTGGSMTTHGPYLATRPVRQFVF